MGAGVAGGQLDRAPGLRLGVVQPPRPLQDVGQRVMRAGVAGGQLDRAPGLRLGVIQPPRLPEDAGQGVLEPASPGASSTARRASASASSSRPACAIMSANVPW